MQRVALLATTAFMALIGTVASAAAVERCDFDPVPCRELITVTATRTAQPAQMTASAITAFDVRDMGPQQIVVVTDILKQVPSLMVNRTGGIGQTTSVSIRGAEQGQTVTLIDGMRINDPSDVSEGAIFADVLANNIKRIEIVRGPQSTLYGSDAIGGVINILTNSGGDTPFELKALAEGGSFGTFHGNVAATGTQGIVDYGVALNYFSNNGVSMADRRNGNPENDGYTNLGASLNTSVHISDTVSVDLRGYYTHGHAEFDDNFGGPPLFAVADSAANSTNELKAGYLGVNVDLFGNVFHNRVAFIATSGDREFFDSAFDTIHLNFGYEGNAARLEYQGIVDVDSDTQITFGVETQDSSFRGSTFSSFAPPDIITGSDRLTGYYLQGQATFFDQLTLIGGVRLDDDEAFGTNTSYKFNAAWNIPDWNTTLYGNVGTGFKAPSLYQLFSANSNPIDQLKPESATGWEVGVNQSLLDDRVRLSLDYFDRSTTNQIDFQNCFFAAQAPGCPFRLAAFGYYINLNKTHASGVEAVLKADITDTLRVDLTYTNMSAVNELTHLDLARRPQNLASGAVTWRPWDGTTLSATITYQGKRFNDNGNFTPLSSNTQVNLSGSYDLTQSWQLFGRVDNVFNDRTEQVFGYGVPGIGAFAGIRATL